MKNHAVGHNHPPESAHLDWDHAVRTATALLQEQLVLPDAAGHPLLTDQAASLAALLCAFGKLAEGVDRMDARINQPLVGKQPGTLSPPPYGRGQATRADRCRGVGNQRRSVGKRTCGPRFPERKSAASASSAVPAS